MKQKLLRFSLMSILAMFVGITAWAQSYTWVKTDISSLSNGDVVVVLETALYNKALLNTEATSSGSVKASDAVTLSADGTQITSTVAANIQWVYNGTTSSFTLKSNDDDARQLQCRNNNDALRVKATSAGSAYKGTFTWDSEYKMIKSTEFTRYLGIWKNSDSDYQWRAYNSQTSSNINGCETSFYKRTDSSDSRTDATWSVSPASASVEIGKTTTITLTTNYDQTLTFTPEDATVATASYNTSTKEITITGVNVGTTTINVTGSGSTTYKNIDKSINVTVTVAELAYKFQATISELSYTYFGLTPEGANSYAQPDVTETTKTDASGIKLVFAKADGSTQPRFDDTYARIYKDNKLTINAPTGTYITKIVFVEPSSNKAWAGSLDVKTGTYDSSAKTWYALTPDVSSVVFTNDNTKRIGGVEVYIAGSITATIDATYGWATFSSTLPLDFTGTDVTAYIITGAEGTTVTKTAVTKVPANTGLLITGTTAAIPVIAAADATDNVDGNKLTAVTATTTVAKAATGSTNYILSANGTTAVFKYVDTYEPELEAGHAYLTLSGAPATAPFLSIEDDGEGTTGISTIETAEPADGAIYDLQGRHVVNPTKGIYIVNGKKVVVK